MAVMKEHAASNDNMNIDIQPVFDESALVVNSDAKALVFADLHLGIEWDLYRSGFSIPSRTQSIIQRMLLCIEKESPDKIILLGDVKHNVPQVSWQERDEIPYFLSSLCEYASVDILPGNHDGGIEFLLPGGKDITVHKSRGAVIDGVGYFHGHTWPDPSLLKAKNIITAHNHPTIRLTDSLGYATVEKSWIRTNLDLKVIQRHFKTLDITIDNGNWMNPLLIIVPAFNELCGGVAFNESLYDNLLGPLFSSKAVNIDNAEAYLLNGTNLGKLKNIRKMEESRQNRAKRCSKVKKK